MGSRLALRFMQIGNRLIEFIVCWLTVKSALELTSDSFTEPFLFSTHHLSLLAKLAPLYAGECW